MINLGSRLVSRLNSDCWHRRYWHVLNRLARNTKLPLHHEPAPISAAYRLLLGAPPRISLRCPTVQQLRATPTDKTLRRRPTFSFSKSAAYETLRGCLIRRKDRTKVNPDEQLQHRRLYHPSSTPRSDKLNQCCTKLLRNPILGPTGRRPSHSVECG